MLAPLSWLKEYVDIDVDVKTLKEKLFSCGFEVEEIVEVGKDITGVYVGLVEECQKIEGTHLSVCKVNVAQKGTFQICCGADNVAVGKKFPVALEGATVFMPNKQDPANKDIMTIKNTKIRGVESFGMLCSGQELGVSENFYKGADYDGLLELDDSTVVGQDFKQAVGLKDFVFDISVTANRPDCQSILGIAREISAVLEKPLKMPNLTYDSSPKQANFSVEVKDFELCPRYEAHLATDIKVEKSPLWLRKRLELVGVNPINNIVDITNYVLKEIGQPMHAFDREFLQGDKIVVKKANNKEEFVALDEQKYELNESNLVIADANKTVAIAGVMGSLHSSINQNTKNIVFETAKFERSSVRKTSRALGLASDSSSRFEKGVDEFSVSLGMQRALHLLQFVGGGKPVSKTIVVAKDLKTQEKFVSASIEKINAVLGIIVPNKDILRILTNLKFNPIIEDDKLTVTVPPYRTDIETYQDLAEEIIRMYGYENIENSFLKFASITAGQRTKAQKMKNQIRSFLYAQGYMESITYSFFSPKDLDLIKVPENHKLRKTIQLLNPLKENISLMRTTLAPSMIASVVRNLKKNNNEGRLFEISRIFLPKQLPLKEYPDEKETLALGVFGKDEDYFTIKGTIEDLAQFLGLEFKFERADKKFLHPGISANILLNGEEIGYFGMIAHDVREELSVEKQFFVAELDYEKITENSFLGTVYTNIVGTVIVKRDLALVADQSLTNGKIEDAIRTVSENIVNVELFDIYKGKQIGDGQKSMAYHIDIQLLDNEQTEENANKIMQNILQVLKDELNVEIRQ